MTGIGDLQLANLDLDLEGSVLSVYFNRPDLLNPLDQATIADIRALLYALETASNVQIVVIRGRGRAFSAGGDLKKHLAIHQDVAVMACYAEAVRNTFERIEQSKQLFIAVVDGLAVAGGIELMLRCDIVLASDESAFSDGHLNVSLLPGGGGTQLIPRMINPLRAKLFMLTAGFIDGRTAAEFGLVSAAYPRDRLEDEVASLIETLLSKSYGARSAIKYLVNQSMRTTLDAGLSIETAFVEHFETTHPHAHEGLKAFSEKRKPSFV